MRAAVDAVRPRVHSVDVMKLRFCSLTLENCAPLLSKRSKSCGELRTTAVPRPGVRRRR